MYRHVDRLSAFARIDSAGARRPGYPRRLLGSLGRLVGFGEQAQRGSRPYESGVNLIGFATGEFGLGELTRMIARTLATADIPFGVIDFQAGTPLRSQDNSIAAWIDPDSHRFINLLSLNPDHLLKYIETAGPDRFAGHYNVGYWAWSLDTCPPPWRKSIELMDEIWTLSSFVAPAFRNDRTPVHAMPLAVSTQGHEDYSALVRADFGIPAEAVAFLFSFDAWSAPDRKNPIATVRAFQAAFPGREDVVLVLKTMNASAQKPRWGELLAACAGDARIMILNETFPRSRVLGLINCCDVFVSLHRAEGFGFGIAEAMLLGKPVVVTGYSGNMDFTRPDNALLVDYRLVPVEPGQYHFWEPGQQWAEPDIDCAARLMRELSDNAALRHRIGLAARRQMQTHHTPEAVSRFYAERIAAIHAGAEMPG